MTSKTPEQPGYQGKAKIGWFDHRTDLPDCITIGIGQIVVEWSVLERELEELIRLLMDADIQHVRIVTNSMKAQTRLSAAQHLIEGHIINGKLKAVDLTDLTVMSKDWFSDTGLQNKRDRFAHGLWAKDDATGWSVLRTRQKRVVVEFRDELSLEKTSRPTLPQPQPVIGQDLLDVAREISAASAALVSFCQRLEASLAPLRHKLPEYNRGKRSYPPKTITQ
jgi:hypothetical protein